MAKKAKKQMQSALTTMGFEAFAAAIKAPEGFAASCFSRKEGFGQWERETQVLLFTQEGVKIEVVFHSVTAEADEFDFPASGHVTFTTSQGSFSFDRIGVEDSFYVTGLDTPESVSKKLVEQVKRIEETKNRHARSETVPTLGFVVTPERKSKMIADLKAGKPISFMPSGFGTGYRLWPGSAGKKVPRWSKPAPVSLCKFFDARLLFIEEVECD